MMKLYGFAMTSIIAVAVGGYQYMQNRNDFVALEARVLKVETVCFLATEKKKSTRLEEMPCEAAEAAVSEKRFRNHYVAHRSRLELLYISPADNQRHTAVISAGRQVKQVAGDTFPILAHRRAPEEIRERSALGI